MNNLSIHYNLLIACLYLPALFVRLTIVPLVAAKFIETLDVKKKSFCDIKSKLLIAKKANIHSTY